MIRGMIFDVDGTLLHSSYVWEDAGARYLKKLGIAAEEGLGRKLFTMTLEDGARYLKDTYHLLQEAEEVLEGVLQVVEDFYYHEAQLKEGAFDFLRRLHEEGIPMVIASSSKKEYIEAAFSRLGVLQYFKKVFTCSEAGAGKEQPRIFFQAADCLGAHPEEIWVAEDGLYAMKTAAAAGFRVLGLYDEGSREDWEEIRRAADLALENLSGFDIFWERAAAR